MKINSKKLPIEKVLQKPTPQHKLPKKPWFILRCLIQALSIPDMLATKFSFTQSRMELAGKGPYLILMNHSAFIDLKIAYKIFFPKPFCIVSTTDSFVGKGWLMRKLGCIPTQKFVSDMTLMSDIKHALNEENTSVLMFPEAGYSLDGRATALPQRMGMLLKMLKVPVVTVITEGAFLRQPLYNELRTRKVKVSAHVNCLLTPEEIAGKTINELDEILNNAFRFDNFTRQLETKTVIDSKDRAKGLERILYKCPACSSEGFMSSEKTEIFCTKCGKRYEMDVFGRLNSKNGETEFSHIPYWYDWEREQVKQEIAKGEYKLEADVNIGIIKDYKALYMVGEGKLTHDENGFRLIGCNGKIDYIQSPLASHSLNVDFYWYTIGDVIGIGSRDMLYYCFPKEKIPVAKARLAAEEIYKIKKSQKRRSKEERQTQ